VPADEVEAFSRRFSSTGYTL